MGSTIDLSQFIPRLLGSGSPKRHADLSDLRDDRELRRGVELIRHRGDQQQAELLEHWLEKVLVDYGDRVLSLDSDAAQLWGRLRVPNPQHGINKQIAAIALLHGLTVVTRNTADFAGCGVALLNPYGL